MTVDTAKNKVVSRRAMKANDGKWANVQSTKKGTFLLGGEDTKSECFSVDYNATRMAADKAGGAATTTLSVESQAGFGRESVTMSLNYESKERVLVMGGMVQQQTVAGNMVEGPTNALWMLDTEMKPMQWEKRMLARPTSRFGLINLNDEYLVFFGGYQIQPRRLTTICALCRRIFALRLKDGQWLQLTEKLPLKSEYFAVYSPGSDVVHLFTYRGHHYTIQTTDLMRAINNACDEGKTWKSADAGKTVMPTKSGSLQSLGPKIDEDDPDDEKENQ